MKYRFSWNVQKYSERKSEAKKSNNVQGLTFKISKFLPFFNISGNAVALKEFYVEEPETII